MIEDLKHYRLLSIFLAFSSMAAWGGQTGAQATAAEPDKAAILAERDPAARLKAIRPLLATIKPSDVDFLIKIAESDPDAAIRKAVLGRLNRAEDPRIAQVYERRAASDPDAGVALLALEHFRLIQVQRLGAVFEKRLEQARTANDTKALQTLVPESQWWASYAHGATVPSFLQQPPAVFSAVAPRNSVRAVAIGDYGTGSEGMKRTAAAAAAYHRAHPFDIGLTVGDNLPPRGPESPSDRRWKAQWEDLYAPLGIPFFATTGNHDWAFSSSPAAEILYSQVSRTWRMPSIYYSFTAGPVQFFALATEVMSSAQLEWLDRELSRSTARWKVVYGHHPIYSNGPHGGKKGFDTTLLPVLKNRAHLFVAGHEHVAQHLQPEGGVHFWINTAAGQGIRPAKSSPRTLYTGSFYGFTVIEADAGQLKIGFVDTDGKTTYETTLR